MKKITLIGVFFLLFVAACNNNKSNNSNVVAAPPAAPTTQCLPFQNNSVYNSPYNYNPYNANPYYPANGYSTGYNNYNGNTCSNQVYNDYYNYGFAPYPYSNFNFSYYNNYSYLPLCDCPANYRPVYHGTIGMGCVAISYFNPIAVGAYYWSLTPNNYQWVNWTQVSNSTTVIGNQTNCYQQVAQACFTDQANSCGGGFVCRATAGGSRLGICAQQ